MALDRTALRDAYRQDEEACLELRLEQAGAITNVHENAAATATQLIEDARRKESSGLDAFLATYGLDTEEGIALMCLAEALLRVPDEETADALIRDKVASQDWAEHVGESGSVFVNAATFSLMLTGEVLKGGTRQEKGLANALRRATGRMGEPVIRKATSQAMRIIGGQFVYARTIDEAMDRAKPEKKRGLTHSFDMLGEAAMTFEDAEKYRQAYERAIARLAKEPGDVHTGPGISVKLSALYPKYDFFHAEAAIAALVPIVRDLALQAREANIHFTVDAEEAERLELSLDIIEALVADDDLFDDGTPQGWEGFGMAIQAYQKRGVPLCRWAAKLARKHDRKLFVRLVKGAYWDAEIKLSQVGGYKDYPVFTRKLGTDVSYLACASELLAADDAIYPAFATHNAYTIGAIKALAGSKQFEFQRLHGMGEDIYSALAAMEGAQRTPVRIYAPVGGHKELLAYLVRRLLENGANSSFVNRMADAEVPVAELVTNPVADLAALTPRRNPAIPLPLHIYPNRRNSLGVDLAHPPELEELRKCLAVWRKDHPVAHPTLRAEVDGELIPVHAPQSGKVVGEYMPASQRDIDLALARAVAAQPEWDALGGEARAQLLIKAADLLEENTPRLMDLCRREAGKTMMDAVLEVREAVDFLRYYACEARMLFGAPQPLPGPTGEQNLLRLHGRGVFATISPWNFPLAIFMGPTAAALAAGNTVLAKPAEQTPLIAALAIDLCHEAGIPKDVLQFVPGDGAVGAALTSDPRIAGVAFTGSTATAHAINRSLAARPGAIGTLIAETGGQNAMIVDSSALPEQVTRDVVASAFQSAGQRCSALRVLYLQDDVADEMLHMIKGAFEALVIGDPADFATDVGPVIDAEARAKLQAHVQEMHEAGYPVWRRSMPKECENGHFFAPTIIEVSSILDIDEEQFGPILHVARYPAGGMARVLDDINATGYGLTLGLHSRIDETRRFVEANARVGNFYVNRNQIGAVVGSQPFGGEGLSGTGPKAGGPHYVTRFATERVTTIDTTAAGGNASLLAGG
ncbi:bifunctional proline dehydrogenase/L-glutamate gamma-semialdehyde dehydrogenase PutA [Aurantiacibacter sp. MUD11]|uniref:bifunctional proline dehydrogenase/L-glutamate gamma-semialdehyde dehydrogenase PutA n=1 Tax=Aurantiacibacter sp. MUD11 TaxID=3003265 RepID=UPI0022AA0622|nr:bifunctional proline dehydrogenase/L-glutamate gamma-semialdehyde dehydrogenase PutA [Aurantiacibacter sp. MUD11]WAT17408.1 bifunctional proline dehydrogenase/L-glutamate gamma-semialdehyde dehydrogenase PutA [Aurantiacibacter sp. MUD11]